MAILSLLLAIASALVVVDAAWDDEGLVSQETNESNASSDVPDVALVSTHQRGLSVRLLRLKATAGLSLRFIIGPDPLVSSGWIKESRPSASSSQDLYCRHSVYRI